MKQALLVSFRNIEWHQRPISLGSKGFGLFKRREGGPRDYDSSQLDLNNPRTGLVSSLDDASKGLSTSVRAILRIRRLITGVPQVFLPVVKSVSTSVVHDFPDRHVENEVSQRQLPSVWAAADPNVALHVGSTKEPSVPPYTDGVYGVDVGTSARCTESVGEDDPCRRDVIVVRNNKAGLVPAVQRLKGHTPTLLRVVRVAQPLADRRLTAPEGAKRWLRPGPSSRHDVQTPIELDTRCQAISAHQ